eukprot:15362271-Ditylum_brightwellii.AAC.2
MARSCAAHASTTASAAPGVAWELINRLSFHKSVINLIVAIGEGMAFSSLTDTPRCSTPGQDT